MRRVHVDDVESGALGPDHRLAVPALELCDVGLVHGARLDQVLGNTAAKRWGDGYIAAVEVGGRAPVMSQLDAGQRVVFMDRLDHPFHQAHVPIDPQADLAELRTAEQ